MMSFGQFTQIPDPAFEQALIDEGYDITLDGQVYTSIIDQISYLDLSNTGLMNLSGIEDFISLTGLNLSGNPINDLSPLLNSFSSIVWLGLVNTPNLANIDLSIVSGSVSLGGPFFYSMNQFTNINCMIRLKDCSQSLDLNFDSFSASIISLEVEPSNNIPSLTLSGSNLNSLNFNAGYDSNIGSYVPPNVNNLILQNLPNLTELNIAGMYNIQNMSSFVQQGDINISITNVPSLEYLDLSYYNVNITDLSQFTQLRTAIFYSSNIIDYDLSNSNSLGRFLCGGDNVQSIKICSNEIDTIGISDCLNLNCLSIKGDCCFGFSLGVINTPNLFCLEVDDAQYYTIIANTPPGQINSSINLDSQISFSNNCNNSCSLNCNLSSLNLTELNTNPKQLIKIVDVLGRETPFKPNTPLLYIYNDGTVERKMIIKE